MTVPVRTVTLRLVLLAAVTLSVLLVATSAAFAGHGGDIPVYGDPADGDCRLVDFLYEDGHTDHFVACGDASDNDLTPDLVPDIHVGMLHASCSDVFADDGGDEEVYGPRPDDDLYGEFQKGDPMAADGSHGPHQVAQWTIIHYDDYTLEPGTGPGQRDEIDDDATSEDDRYPNYAKFCSQTFVEPTPDTPIEVCVDLVNDASGDGTYSDDELAPAAGADAPERVTVTNCADDPHVITSLIIDGVAVCDDLLGMELLPDGSVTCDLVAEDRTPLAGETEIDTVTVVVHQPGNPGNTATADDPTAMTTALPPVDVCADLVNDADGDGTYSDDEMAPTAGADVPERVTVTNCGDEPHVIDSVVIDGTEVCPELVGMEQAPGESVTCDLVMPDHAPPVGDEEVDTLVVDVSHPDHPSITASDEDPTVLSTGIESDIAPFAGEQDGPAIAGVGDELPQTGSTTDLLGATGASALLLGLLLLLGAVPIVRQVSYARADLRRVFVRRT